MKHFFSVISNYPFLHSIDQFSMCLMLAAWMFFLKKTAYTDFDNILPLIVIREKSFPVHPTNKDWERQKIRSPSTICCYSSRIRTSSEGTAHTHIHTYILCLHIMYTGKPLDKRLEVTNISFIIRIWRGRSRQITRAASLNINNNSKIGNM